MLIVDLDPQGNASTGLGIDRASRRISTYDVLTGDARLRDAVLETAVPRLHIAASTMDLSGLELEIATARDRPFRLRNAIRVLNQGESSIQERNDPVRYYPCADRLSAVAESHHHQCHGGGERHIGAAAVRVLRA